MKKKMLEQIEVMANQIRREAVREYSREIQLLLTEKAKYYDNVLNSDEGKYIAYNSFGDKSRIIFGLRRILWEKFYMIYDIKDNIYKLQHKYEDAD